MDETTELLARNTFTSNYLSNFPEKLIEDESRPSTMGFVLIGAGKYGQRHYLVPQGSNIVRCAAVVEPNPTSKVKEFCKANDAPLFSDFESFTRSDVEGLGFAIIAAPHDVHLPVTSSLLKSGISVLKEKPLAMSLPEAKKILETYRDARKVYGTNLRLEVLPWRRCDPLFQSGKRLLKNIGNVIWYSYESTMCVDNLGEGWRARRASAGGGCLLDMGWHGKAC